MKEEFNRIIDTLEKPYDEVSLFREMSTYLCKTKADSIFVDEVHGQAGMIEYRSSFTGKAEEVEIADLQIINYNKAKNETRICFVQVKHQKRKGLKDFFSFPGDGLQWELLRSRCNIIVPNRNNFPEHILSFTNYLSITSYGIFHTDNDGKMEFLFTLPEHFCINLPQKKTSMRFCGGSFCSPLYCLNHQITHEIKTICCMDAFEDEICKGNIGALVDASTDGTILAYIASVLKTIYENTHNLLADEIIHQPQFQSIGGPDLKNYLNTLLVISKDKED
jgi:hypothetical protein